MGIGKGAGDVIDSQKRVVSCSLSICIYVSICNLQEIRPLAEVPLFPPLEYHQALPILVLSPPCWSFPAGSVGVLLSAVSSRAGDEGTG